MNKRQNRARVIPETIKEFVRYDSETGNLIQCRVIEKVAGSSGHPVVSIDGNQYQYHRVCYYLHNGTQPPMVYFKDKDRHNTKPDNLIPSLRLRHEKI